MPFRPEAWNINKNSIIEKKIWIRETKIRHAKASFEKNGISESGLRGAFLYHHFIHRLFHHIKGREMQGVIFHLDGVKQHLV
jgi:hypothetical protein